MAINYTNTPPEWENNGTEPTDELKTTGFTAGYKPPADYFNWFWSKVSKCIKELQEKLSGTDTTANNHISNKNNPHSVTKAQVGLGNCDNTSDLNKPISTATQTALDDEATAREDGDTAVQGNLDTHISNTSNPHAVTKSQVGLGNVPNVTTNNQTPTYTEASTLTNLSSGETIDTAFGKIKKAITDLISHIGNTSNPHSVTKSQVGLGNVPNVTTNNQTPTYTTASTLSTLTSGEIISTAFGKISKAIVDLISHIGNTSNPHSVTASQVGLGNVNNTSDANKPISTATQRALNAKANTKDLPNIKKNSADTTGDIISTHLTVGKRTSGSTIGKYSFASGDGNTASGYSSIAMGGDNTASDYYSIAMGCNNKATAGYCSIAMGGGNAASGDYSAAIGDGNTASGDYSAAIGKYNTSLAYQTKIGRFTSDGTAGTETGTEGDVLMIGIGTSSVRKNGLRVDYAGNVYAFRTINATGADYAEAWEWLDGNPNNEDRVGRFVAFEGEKIRLATANDPKEILGVISALPAVIGDNFADDWQGMYLKDKFGRLLTEHKSYEAEYDAEGNLIHEAYEADEYIVNPEYDQTLKYIPRLERPEYDAVGTHGKLVVIDDGTCSVGGFCMPSENGIATASENGFYVMERIDETTVKVYVR